jgi:hypothetical protein
MLAMAGGYPASYEWNGGHSGSDSKPCDVQGGVKIMVKQRTGVLVGAWPCGDGTFRAVVVE